MNKNANSSDFNTLMAESMQIPEVREYMNSFSVLFGDLVLSRRVELGWSQEMLAKQAGTTQARISQIESGDSNVQSKTLDKVSLALGLTGLSPSYVDNEPSVTRELVYG